ncbi:hypothetical protein pb186bvf_018387 [Paramecium bursaria]
MKFFLIAVIVICQAIKVSDCNLSQCKTVVSECVQNQECFNNLRNCLKNLKGELTSSKDATEYDTSLDKFSQCMNKGVSTGKVIGCAKHQCEAKFAQFVTMLFNQVQSQSFIGIPFDETR